MFVKQYIIFLIITALGSTPQLWCMEESMKLIKQAENMNYLNEMNEVMRYLLLQKFMQNEKQFYTIQDNTTHYWEPLHVKDLTNHELYQQISYLNPSNSKECCYLKDFSCFSKEVTTIQRWSKIREALAAFCLIKIDHSSDDNAIITNNVAVAMELNDGYFIYYLNKICGFSLFSSYIARANTIEMITLWDLLFTLNWTSHALILTWNLDYNTPLLFFRQYLEYADLQEKDLNKMTACWTWADSSVIKYNFENKEVYDNHKAKLLLLHKLGCKDTFNNARNGLNENIHKWDKFSNMANDENSKNEAIRLKKNYEKALEIFVSIYDKKELSF